MKSVFRPILSFGLIMTLAACGSFNPFREAKPEPCPRITILKNTASQTVFKEGEGRDLIDVIHEASLVNVYSACIYDVDYDSRAGTITMQVAPEVQAMRGPANSTKKAEFEYFVALVDDNEKILNKSIFPMMIGFPGNLTRNQIREEEPVNITIPTDGSKDGEDYEVYVGMQLTAEQMEYNVKKNAR